MADEIMHSRPVRRKKKKKKGGVLKKIERGLKVAKGIEGVKKVGKFRRSMPARL